MAKPDTKSKLNHKSSPAITGDMLILNLTETYPQVVDFLINEYDFHCIGCIMAGFETLEEGAAGHNITGKDFEEMLTALNALIWPLPPPYLFFLGEMKMQWRFFSSSWATPDLLPSTNFLSSWGQIVGLFEKYHSS